ncbi:hypothetical protein K435DRAFT_883521 [Dendrothele bispora CBS 962.96]|uniref:DNA replication factor Cdt1 C-terminal domain-containing protein n=1 Tax=Dendrothele bispora (strain CBS 962.96) TaxID=1314807 RepID=A0A4S8MZE3_DENBC|nr:hypothetical protein K435DRAFT_883521 [Dendrothele bispora CBS 962.96]
MTTLPSSPTKRRLHAVSDNVSPKRLRTAPPTPPTTPSRKNNSETPLPSHLSRLQTIQTELQHALSHALATCALSPSSDTGIIRNVLNHMSLNTYAGFSTQFTIEDLRRLCWIWEWDGKPILPSNDNDEENPFLDTTPLAPSKDWRRGGMGITITSATHLSKADGRRLPAYGLGIEVNLDVDNGGGMAAVARWTSAAEARRTEFQAKLSAWAKACFMHSDPVPKIPMADLPKLNLPGKASSLTQLFASVSPRASSSTNSVPECPPSPSRSPRKSPSKYVQQDPAALSLIGSLSRTTSPKKGPIPFPNTPSRSERLAKLLTPNTLRTITTSDDSDAQESSTPRGRDRLSVSQTPTTARREALYERIRQRSLSTSPSKNRRIELEESDLSITKDQMLKMEQEEMRRRCLLGRLGGVAESVWMLFSTPTTGTSSLPTSRKRRMLPRSDVASAVIKSSPVPISSAEANESLDLLTRLCPFFLKSIVIASEDWLEMPPSTTSTAIADGSPIRNSDHELLTRSPKRVKKEAGGLREVREIIRRELELHD